MRNEALATLVCGNYTQHESIKSLYDVLSHNISNMGDRLKRLLEDDDDDLTVLGPYYARNLLETTCSALLGRIDPFRLIYVQKVQSLDGFKIGSKSKAAISWAGDILEKNDINIEELWKPDRDFSKVGRGLFGNHYGEIYWNPAFKSLIDDEAHSEEPSLSYFKTSIDSPDKFVFFLRQESSKLFSSLSKGIHSELVIKPEIIYDKPTVIDLINDTFQLCSILGIVSHRIDFSISCINPIEAFVWYKEIFDWRDDL